MHKDKRLWTYSSAVEYLPSTHEALGWIPSTTKTTKHKQEQESVWVFTSIVKLMPVLGKMHALSIQFREYH